jgi:hypothetical protein
MPQRRSAVTKTPPAIPAGVSGKRQAVRSPVAPSVYAGNILPASSIATLPQQCPPLAAEGFEASGRLPRGRGRQSARLAGLEGASDPLLFGIRQLDQHVTVTGLGCAPAEQILAAKFGQRCH